MDLQAFGVKFDQYYLESSLYKEGRVEKTVKALVAAGKTYEQEGALWLRTTDDGDDKDRVMRKTDGTYTYFVPDVAYHVAKWERGFTKVINVQGSDHHGTIARVRAGLQGLGIGIPKGYPDYILHKMVTVMRDGQEVKISKRAGSYVTVRDLIEWSGGATPGSETAPDLLDEETIRRGRDAVRFFLISRKADTEFVFDIDLALKQNDENPVHYVQYAHARICSVISEWKTRYNARRSASCRTSTCRRSSSERAMALLQQARRISPTCCNTPPTNSRRTRSRSICATSLANSTRSTMTSRTRPRRRRGGAQCARRIARGHASGAGKRPCDDRRLCSRQDVSPPARHARGRRYNRRPFQDSFCR